MKYILFVACFFMLSGCLKSDPEKRHQYFLECLDHTKVNRDVHYNDTDEMIDECNHVSFEMSLTPTE